MTIPAGKKVAIVGPSGCGKSTVFRLLFRFYDSDSGRILIDGQDIKTVSLETLRKAIGVVPQDTPLFHADILHNVRYGNLDATDDEVIEACKKAQVDATVQKLPEKYHTKVGERGLMISGGEKQRLAVARLLLKDPPILFFDEATSALDVYTETELMRNINTTLIDGTKTSVFIAHRLRTISDAGMFSFSRFKAKLMSRSHYRTPGWAGCRGGNTRGTASYFRWCIQPSVAGTAQRKYTSCRGGGSRGAASSELRRGDH
jgi:ATP-binding cassette subfamily B (MDR/TAP) protein 7